MKLSFVIPAHNEENYIGNCLKSVLKEIKGKHYDVEIIVVNNASTDSTKEVALAYQGVKVVDEPKRGLPRARQTGFLASNGDLIANIDADTELPSGWIEKVFFEFSRNKNLVALSGPFIYYDRSKLTNFFVWSYYSVGYLLNLVNHYLLRIGAMLQGGNFVLRRTALEKIGGFNTNIEFYGEDTDIAKRIQKIGRAKFSFFLPMYTSARRLSEEGIFVTSAKYVINYFWVLIFKKPFKSRYTYVGNTNKNKQL